MLTHSEADPKPPLRYRRQRKRYVASPRVEGADFRAELRASRRSESQRRKRAGIVTTLVTAALVAIFLVLAIVWGA